MKDITDARSPVDADALRDDLAQGWGLPTSFYADPEIHQLDLDAIFRRSWQYFCPSARVATPGNSVIGMAGDVPVVIVRGDDGELRGFVNMCRHRGYKVATKDQANCKRLVCRYHAWSYWVNGDLAHAPGSDDEPGFDKSGLSLKPVQLQEWGPAILVNADVSAPGFFEAHPNMKSEAERLGVELNPEVYTFVRETCHDVPSNWKVWYDNFVECYHCDNIHRSSFSAAYESDISSVDTTFNGTFMASRFAPKATGTKTTLRANNYRSLNIFPGLLILQQDELMILSQMRPIGTEVTEQKVHYFAEAGADPDRVEEWIALWEQTFGEDGEAVAIQQEGLRTGAIARNRLMPNREEAVVFFNGLVIDAYGRSGT
jgi:phenylpropionate dioxygenase-like ring-hydroxylating dioxygenase large terminal subunit